MLRPIERFEIQKLDWHIPSYSCEGMSSDGNAVTYDLRAENLELTADATLIHQNCGELAEALAEEIRSHIDSDLYLFTYSAVEQSGFASIFLLDKQLMVHTTETEIRVSRTSLFSRTDHFDDTHRTQMKFVRRLSSDERFDLYDPNSISDLLAYIEQGEHPKSVSGVLYYA